MKHTTLILLLFSTPCLAIEEDKVKHFAVGGLIGSLVNASTQSQWKGFAAGCIAGVAKEAYDRRGHGKAEAADIAATCLGSSLSFTVNF